MRADHRPRRSSPFAAHDTSVVGTPSSRDDAGSGGHDDHEYEEVVDAQAVLGDPAGDELADPVGPESGPTRQYAVIMQFVARPGTGARRCPHRSSEPPPKLVLWGVAASCADVARSARCRPGGVPDMQAKTPVVDIITIIGIPDAAPE